jgi:hypothetical protein
MAIRLLKLAVLTHIQRHLQAAPVAAAAAAVETDLIRQAPFPARPMFHGPTASSLKRADGCGVNFDMPLYS